MRTLIPIFLICCLGIIVYSNTFHYPFQFDDHFFILDNYAIQDIHHLQNIWQFLPCRFLFYLSLALNYHFYQLDVFSYHLVNLGIHLISAILVWWLVLLTLSTPAMKKGLTDYNKGIELNPHLGIAYINRSVIYYKLKRYDNAWDDVHKAEESGATVNPGFINALAQASGRDR